MPLRSLTGARWPFWNSASEASKARQATISPATPPSILAFSAALYSVGAEGAKFSLIPGCADSKAGMILSCQILRSSLRQLSIVRVTSSARAAPASAASAAPASRARIRMVVIVLGLPFWLV